MIPAGFKLAPGWLATGLGTCWGKGHPNPDVRVIGPFIDDDGECLCADHAIKAGALVPDVPVATEMKKCTHLHEHPDPCDGDVYTAQVAICGALRGLESWSPSCDLREGHDGSHRWRGPSTDEKCRAIEDSAYAAVTADPVLSLGNDTPWPLREVLLRLAEAADHLLIVHHCDRHGHEVVASARDAARTFLALSAAELAGLREQLRAANERASAAKDKLRRIDGAITRGALRDEDPVACLRYVADILREGT